MERFMIIVYGWKPLTIITKRSILDVAAVLDPPLLLMENFEGKKVTSKKISLWVIEDVDLWRVLVFVTSKAKIFSNEHFLNITSSEIKESLQVNVLGD